MLFYLHYFDINMQATKSHRFVDPLEWIRIVSFHSRKLFVCRLCVLRGLHSFQSLYFIF